MPDYTPLTAGQGAEVEELLHKAKWILFRKCIPRGGMPLEKEEWKRWEAHTSQLDSTLGDILDLARDVRKKSEECREYLQMHRELAKAVKRRRKQSEQ